MFTLVTILISCYLLIVIFVFFYQRSLLYHPSENNYTNDTVEFTFEEVSIPTPTGIKIKGWFHKKDLNQKKTLVFFHQPNWDAKIKCLSSCIGEGRKYSEVFSGPYLMKKFKSTT